MKKIITTLLLCCSLSIWATDLKVSSPDNKMQVTIHMEAESLTWEVEHAGTKVLTHSEIGINGHLKNMKGKLSKDKNVAIIANKLYTVEMHVDNDAVAYRILYNGKKPILVHDETAEFMFAEDFPAYIPYVNDNRSGERWCYSFESYYDMQPLSQMYGDSLAINPLAVRLPKGKLAVILDANVLDYPGMFLQKKGSHGLSADFAPYPLQEEIGGFSRLNLIPTERADYIAKIKGQAAMPWRILVVTENDAQLPCNDIARRYGPTCRLKDTSWIKPGKVAWDWWNNTNLTGVDFRAGMNTDTYKYYIDFAHKNHLEYIIIDEGWSSEETLMEMSPEIDLIELLSYAKNKNVGIILWSSWRNAIKDMEQCFKYYSDLGVKGFKVDFFDRDDQVVMQSALEMANCAVRHHLLLDFHGYRPTGIQYAYPNIVNFEGVKGLENSKWEPRVGDGPLHDQPLYDVTIPYLRMLVGPLDYTPGAMANATKDQFFGNNNHPMSQGTRAHQVAMYTLFDAPLQMLADSPTKYMKEQETTDFIAPIPTTWDESICLCGEIGEYVVIARRKGNIWYIAGMTNWNARDVEFSLDMLTADTSLCELFCDGVNADRDATDYRHAKNNVKKGQKVKVHMAPGGGFTMKITH